MRGASDKDVRNFARLAGLSTDRARRHVTVPDAVAFHSDALNEIFGQKRFAKLNQEHGVFDVVRASCRGKATDAYRLQPSYREAMERALDESDARDEVAIKIRPDGRQRRVVPPGIDRESLRDTNSIWRTTEVRTVTPVNLPLLRATQDELRAISVIGAPARDARLEALGFPAGANVPMYLSSLRPIIDRGRAELPGRGFIATNYTQVGTGRLFESEPGLQGAPRLIKAVAMSDLGLWAWDIENCHPAIIKQLAERQGLACPVIGEYIECKDKRREQIALDVGITIDEAKGCLIALFYGSRQRFDDGKKDAVHKEVGLEKSRAFFAHPFVRRLTKDLARVGPLIEKAWPRAPGGCLINVARMAYNGKQRVARDKKDTWSTRLAHVVQGYEVAALHSIVTADKDRGLIVLLEHDGWTAREGMDRSAIEATILASTGLRLSVEGKAISAPRPN